MLKRKGFTLIELIVVVIIIGILAAIAAPIMSSMSLKTKKAEAIAALGSIRTAERSYYAEHGVYTLTLNELSSYIARSDLDGKYFTNQAYYLLSGWQWPSDNYEVLCNAESVGYNDSSVRGVFLCMKDDGTMADIGAQ